MDSKPHPVIAESAAMRAAATSAPYDLARALDHVQYLRDVPEGVLSMDVAKKTIEVLAQAYEKATTWRPIATQPPTEADGGAQGTVLIWYPGCAEPSTRHWRYAKELGTAEDPIPGAMWITLPAIPRKAGA